MATKRIARRSRTGLTIPVAVAAGFTPMIWTAIEASKSMGLTGAAYTVTSHLTGYSLADKKWYFNDLVRGWTPILIGLALHKVAGRLGINRALSASGIPIFRI